MSTSVDFYTIVFSDDTGPLLYQEEFFFRELRKLFKKKDPCLIKNIDNKKVRLLKIYEDFNNPFQVVYVLGTYKQEKPYYFNNKNELEELPMEMFDITSMAYDSSRKVALVTSSREGPSARCIGHYLSSFLQQKQDQKIFVYLSPLHYYRSLSSVRNANQVKNVKLTLNLDKPLDALIENEAKSDKAKGLISALRNISSVGQKTDSHKLEITMSVGMAGRRNGTLDAEELTDILYELNLDAEVISQITIEFRDQKNVSYSTAQLKNQTRAIKHQFSIKGSKRLSPEYLLAHMDEAFEAESIHYREPLKKIIDKKAPYGGECVMNTIPDKSIYSEEGRLQYAIT